MLTEAQLKDRLNYLGGSDAAAVLGLSRWKTPLQIWGEKTGNIIPADISDNLPVKLGNKLEQTVAELFTEETGLKVRRVNQTIFHPEYAFLGANLDRMIVGTDAILEAKTCSPWKAKEWDGEEIPQEYIVQVMHYMAVTGARKAYVAVLIGNQDFKVKCVDRDEQVISEMVRKEVEFWKTYIEPKRMPMSITSRDADTLYELFPMQTPGAELVLGEEVNEFADSRAAMLQDLKSLQVQIEKFDNEIKARMGYCEVGSTSKHVVTWKAQKQVRIDIERLKAEDPEIFHMYSKEIPMRVLRIKARKENE